MENDHAEWTRIRENWIKQRMERNRFPTSVPSSDTMIKARISAIAMLKQGGKINDAIHSGIDRELAEACHREIYKTKPILGSTTHTWAENIQILRYTETMAEVLNMWSRRNGWTSKLGTFEIEEIRAYCRQSDEKDVIPSHSAPQTSRE